MVPRVRTAAARAPTFPCARSAESPPPPPPPRNRIWNRGIAPAPPTAKPPAAPALPRPRRLRRPRGRRRSRRLRHRSHLHPLRLASAASGGLRSSLAPQRRPRQEGLRPLASVLLLPVPQGPTPVSQSRRGRPGSTPCRRPDLRRPPMAMSPTLTVCGSKMGVGLLPSRWGWSSPPARQVATRL